MIRRFGYVDPIIAIDPTINILTGTLDGLSCLSQVLLVGSLAAPDRFWWYSSFINFAVSTTGWAGTSISLGSPINFTDKIVAIECLLTEIASDRFGEKGVVMLLSDNNNNWVAFSLGTRSSWLPDITKNLNIDVTNTTPYDFSGSIDFTNIDHVTFLVHRKAVTSTQYLLVKNLMIKGIPLLIRGSAVAPIDPGFVDTALDGETYFSNSGVQGKNQGLSYSGLQLGDGFFETYVNFAAGSYETGLVDTNNQLVANKSMQFIIKASASDIINLESCVIATTSRQNFSIDAASSVLASYSFLGASLVNWDVFWKAGITCNGSNLSNCIVTQLGGEFDNCFFVDSTVISEDLHLLVGCNFISSGTGHAVEMPTSVTVIDANNNISWDCTFDSTDYAIIDGTTGNEVLKVDVDAGVTLTINISETANSPTVYNTGDGTVEKVYAQKTFSFTLNPSITGYEWRLYEKNITEGTIGTVELEGEEVATVDNQSYNYSYISDTDVVLQVIADGYEESLTNFVLGGSNQDVVIVLNAEHNT